MITLVVFFIVRLIKSKKNKCYLKTKNRYKLIIMNEKYFFCSKNNFLFVDLNLLKIKSFRFVKQLDYVLKKIKLNCPKIYNKPINYNQLEKLGVQPCYPVYFEEKLTKEKLDVLLFARSCVDYNLVVLANNKCSNAFYDKLAELGVVIVEKTSLSYSVLSWLYLANINFDISNNLEIENKKEGLIVFDGKRQLTFNNQIDEYKICDVYNDDNIYAIVNKFNDECYKIKLQNKTATQKTITINYYKSLNNGDVNYYKFIKKKSNILCYSVITKQYFYYKCSHSFCVSFSRVKNMKHSNLPKIEFNKKIVLKPFETQEFEICKTDNLCETFESCYAKIKSQYDKLFMITLVCNDDKLNQLFNFELKENIILQQFDKFVHYEINSFAQGYALYKLKKVSALDLYNYILNNLLGVKLDNGYLYIKPKLSYDFELILKVNNKKFIIDVKHGDKKGIVVDGTRFVNCYNIHIERLNKISLISLVI